MSEIDEIVLVVHADDVGKCQQLVAHYGITKPITYGIGFGERQDSVRVGLQLVSSEVTYVLIHDAVRPFVKPEQVRACLDEAKRGGAAILAVPAKDTIKIVDAEKRVVATPDRQSLWQVQTPQAFRLSSLKEAHDRAEREQFHATDDAMVAEWAGMTVKVVQGDYTNIKITTPEDLAIATVLLMGKETFE
jgi:2-C-methyl-D-erythritol 4-phosphate cytidylyltransferase